MYWDIHCHADRLTQCEIEEAVEKEIIIGAVAMDRGSACKILELKSQYPENIRVFLGIHPEVESSEDEIDEMLKLIEDKRELVDGIGEVGIPYFYMEDMNPKEKTEAKRRGAGILARFVEAAVRHHLPLNLHVVEEDIDLALPILESYRAEGALFHWYEGSREQLKRIIGAGHFISVSPEAINNNHYFDFVVGIPLTHLLLESDAPCPYGEEKGVPIMILKVAERLAEYHGIEVEELLKTVGENTLNYLNRRGCKRPQA